MNHLNKLVDSSPLHIEMSEGNSKSSGAQIRSSSGKVVVVVTVILLDHLLRNRLQHPLIASPLPSVVITESNKS